ncbi:MAG: homocysteine S-methyltransferase family protein [Oscillospiraceae bacterium]|nr:homocysteine S-methyltransferase family protein [Oscillospiraceae bacterium]
MGTMLQAAGLPVGQLPELWNISEPEKVTEIQRRYVEAGSRLLYTNTFGANRLKLASSDFSVADVVSGAVRCARAAASGRDVRVALDIGPIGQLLEPLGTLKFDEAYDIFREIITAGSDAGVDLIVIETMSDLYEVKAAVLAARENSELPIWVTMTFEAGGRTFLGVTVPSMALTLSGLGVDALGFNCSLGPRDLIPLIRELRRWTDLPLILKPNAGLPNPATGAYSLTPEEFVRELSEAPELGIGMIGGCCGTTPDFIRALSVSFSGRQPSPRPLPDCRGICSAANTAVYDDVRIIGERINPTGKKRFQQALREGDIDYIVARGIEQQDAGADILDVNVGIPGIDEPAMMARTVRALQAAVDLPLQIDSSDPLAIEAGLRAVNGRAIVNSVNGKREVLDRILPLCKKYGAAVVGLCLDENGIPETAQGRIEIAARILDAALDFGIPREDVFIDCLTLTVSAQQEQAAETLQALRYVSGELGLHTVLGVSNISFGLPERENITVSFLTQALQAGLSFPIVNPNQAQIMNAIRAFRVLSGKDKNCEDYIRHFVNTPAALSSSAVPDISLTEAILRGLRQETATLTEKELQSRDELDVVNRLLIPALDLVGERYEKQEIFLPQLINAANAACGGFEVIKDHISRRGAASVSRGKIILATVRGDIHDIGKNIVRVVLENYGYNVLDLGRDVPPSVIVETAISENVRLVGLSALMTTTVSSMAETIRALRQSGHDCKIMVGGAVLTPEYAREIGADYYAGDAKQSADIARQVLG